MEEVWTPKVALDRASRGVRTAKVAVDRAQKAVLCAKVMGISANQPKLAENLCITYPFCHFGVKIELRRRLGLRRLWTPAAG